VRRARVLIAQEKFRWAVANPKVVVEEVSRVSRLLEAFAIRKPAVAVIALDLPGLGGAAGLRQLRELSPSTKIIAVVRKADESEEVEVLRTGAKGYLTQTLTNPMFDRAIEKVQEGEIWAGRRAIGSLLDELLGAPVVTDDAASETRIKLAKQLRHLTPRELEIVRRIANGATNKEIAATLNVSVSTVKAHLTSIFRKLDQPDRLRLALHLTQSVRDEL
jgi:two-component system nitrate/nitrite response regulator NarL